MALISPLYFTFKLRITLRISDVQAVFGMQWQQQSTSIVDVLQEIRRCTWKFLGKLLRASKCRIMQASAFSIPKFKKISSQQRSLVQLRSLLKFETCVSTTHVLLAGG